MIDLHVHSTFSDGTDSPRQLALMGKHLGLSAMALTDHDTAAGLAQFSRACAECGIEPVCGIEFSALYHDFEIHIVGLFINPDCPALSNAIVRLQADRAQRNADMAEKFRASGILVDLEEMQRLYPVSVLTRAHFADYLLKKSLVSSRNEAFDRYLGNGRPCYVQRKTMSAFTAIDLIHEAGGAAVLAHPLLYRTGRATLSETVSDLKRHGLDALEALYSTFSTGEEEEMKQLAKENHLKISGGSDYHGANKPDIRLGTGRGRLQVPDGVLIRLKESLPRLRQSGAGIFSWPPDGWNLSSFPPVP